MNKESLQIREVMSADPGVDDALAILVGWEALEKPAIIATYGNSSTLQTSCNLEALKRFHQKNSKRPQGEPLVFTGTDRSLNAEKPFDVNIEFIHGKLAMEGAGKWVRPICKNSNQLYETLEKNLKKPIDVFSFGGVTEIYHLLNRRRRLSNNIRSITLMGGAINQHGNTDMHQEANFRHDPIALRKILESAEKKQIPITIVPLDVTEEEELELTPERVIALAENLQKRGSANIANYLLKLLGPNATYSKFYRSRSGVYEMRTRIAYPKVYKGPPIHDLTALYAQTNPDLFIFEEYPIRVNSEGVVGIGGHYGVNAQARVAVALKEDSGEKYWQITEDYLAKHYN